MTIYFHRHFNKRFARLSGKIQKRALERVELFSLDPFNEILRNHALTANFLGLRSIDITGDVRAIYQLVSAKAVLFVDIGTHSQLYK